MTSKSSRSARILKMIQGIKDATTPTESRKQRDASYYVNLRRMSLRSRRNLPSYAPPNTSIDDSFDIIDNEKHRDETYLPSTDDDTANSSNLNNDLTDTLMDDITNDADDSDSNYNETCLPDQRPMTDIETPRNTLLSDSVATSSPPLLDADSNVIIEANANILADNSNNSVIQNSEYLNVLEQPQNPMHSESGQSCLTITNQSLSNVLEQSPYQMHVTLSNPNECNLTKNHTITSQSLSQDHTTQIQDSVPTTSGGASNDGIPNFSHDNSSEFDDSDKDPTYISAFEKSSSITSYTEETEEVLNKTHQNQQLCLRLRSLEEPQNPKLAYNTLTETVYCRVLLLNRRRPGELQRLPLSIYQEISNDKSAYEEFDRAISSAEKVLVNSFKRIVIRGKRGRGVPVLLTDEVQSDINLLISVRRNYICEKNDFLFAKPGSESTLCGYKVLKKYATASGARNPAAITTTKLRKHLATLTQMFNLKESDIEQLANFMGHTQAVHRQNYRLPDDVYQTAKLSKLLLLMESGKADSYRGKCLDDINLDLEQDLLENAQGHDNYDSDELIDYDAALPTEKSKETEFTDDNPVLTPQSTLLSDATNATHIKTKKKRNVVPWTTEQKSIVKKFFSKHIKNKQPPKRHECEELRSQHTEILHNKDWLKIKVFVQNAYTNNK
ncbi:unnamed protein product [Parnassius apollo]|uniref:(apollo) hypothetical protein n=1 Tax=Parnassius apollo TaxID=110799 RepID=A0A8S3Y9H8_PARAO|nr:unnamed protein product [Parnassius apollo]